MVLGTFRRDHVVEQAAAAAGLPILDGYSPAGAVVARGVRFANGVFVEAHQAPSPDPSGPPPLLGLSGSVDAAEALAERHGWRVSVQRRPEDLAVPAEPWSILSFRRRQGALSSLFVIDYVAGATAAPDFAGPLYIVASTPDRGPRLQRVWLAVAEIQGAIRDLTRLGFAPGGVVRSTVAPHAGWLLRGQRGDVVLHEAGEGPEGITRFDIEPGHRAGARVVEPAPGLVMVLGR